MDLDELKAEGERLTEELKSVKDQELRTFMLNEIESINKMINEQVKLEHEQQRIDIEEAKIKVEDLENERKAQLARREQNIDATKSVGTLGAIGVMLFKLIKFEETGVITSKAIQTGTNLINLFTKII